MVFLTLTLTLAVYTLRHRLARSAFQPTYSRRRPASLITRRRLRCPHTDVEFIHIYVYIYIFIYAFINMHAYTHAHKCVHISLQACKCVTLFNERGKPTRPNIQQAMGALNNRYRCPEALRSCVGTRQGPLVLVLNRNTQTWEHAYWTNQPAKLVITAGIFNVVFQ